MIETSYIHIIIRSLYVYGILHTAPFFSSLLLDPSHNLRVSSSLSQSLMKKGWKERKNCRWNFNGPYIKKRRLQTGTLWCYVQIERKGVGSEMESVVVRESSNAIDQ